MTDTELLAVMNRVCHWQVADDRHPLTCGEVSDHPPLFPVIHGRQVVLRCAFCSYRQEHIPQMFLKP